MPIRFRCADCGQLMSIATRKAGAVIRCTRCARELIVPIPDGQAPVEPAGQAFESADFDVELEKTMSAPPGAAAPPAPLAESRPAGIFLSAALLCVCVAIVVLLLVAMFAAGFFVGQITPGAF
jgi:ribosomal protein S27E